MEVISDKEQEQRAEDKRLLGLSSEMRWNPSSYLALWTVPELQLHLKNPSRTTDGAYNMLHLLHQSATCGSFSYS